MNSVAATLSLAFRCSVILTVFFLAACASTPAVDDEEPRRLVGREADIKVDAQVFGDRFASGSPARVIYEIENLRPEAIAIADVIAETSYDEETRTITVNFGAEIPGNQLLPRLIRIDPGEKQSFGARARLSVTIPPAAQAPYPKYLRLRFHFLDNVRPFQTLLDIPEKAIQDSALADRLFTAWIEHQQPVATNAIPILWGGAGRESGSGGRDWRPPTPRRRPL